MQQQEQYNRVGQFSPLGSVTWEDAPMTQADIAKQRQINQIKGYWAKGSSDGKQTAAMVQKAYGGDINRLFKEKGIDPNMPAQKKQMVTKLAPSQQKIWDSQQEAQALSAQQAKDYQARVGALLSADLPKMQEYSPYTMEDLVDRNANGAYTAKALGGMEISPETLQFKEAAPDASSGLLARDRVEAALRERANPMLQTNQDRLRSTLVNQGLRPGTEAWQKSWNDLNRQENDLNLGIMQQGLGEQQGQYGMALNSWQSRKSAAEQNFSNLLNAYSQRQNERGNVYDSQRQDALTKFNSEIQRRNQSLAELAQLYQNSGQVQIPTSAINPTISAGSPADMAGAYGQYNQSRLGTYNAGVAGANASNASTMGTGAALAGTAVTAAIAL
jgi:hypothetical protein